MTEWAFPPADGNREHDIHEAQEQLKGLLQREISILREMLGSMQVEQSYLLSNSTNLLKPLMQEREQLLATVTQVRDMRGETVQKLTSWLSLDIDGEEFQDVRCIENLIQSPHIEGTDLAWLRDQLVALLNKMNDQNSHNNYLIQNRIRHTKELVRRLSPDNRHLTYQGNGKYASKTKVTTVTLINREG